MTLSINLDNDEAIAFLQHAKDRNVSLDEFARTAILEKIFADDDDLAAYEKAMAEYKKNPVSYPFEEVMKRIDSVEAL